MDDDWDPVIDPKHNIWKIPLPGVGDLAPVTRHGVVYPSGVAFSFDYTTSPRCVALVASKAMRFKGETRSQEQLEKVC
jgi:hypothetical protein